MVSKQLKILNLSMLLFCNSEPEWLYIDELWFIFLIH